MRTREIIVSATYQFLNLWMLKFFCTFMLAEQNSAETEESNPTMQEEIFDEES